MDIDRKMASENRPSVTAGIKQFDGKGFATWKIRIRAALDELGIANVIKSESSTMSEKAFIPANRKAKNIIIQCLHDRVLHGVQDKETAKEIMDTLEKTYSRSGLSEQIALKEKLSNLKFRNGSLSTYFEEFDCVVTNLINAGAEIQEKELVTILLSGMPRSYNSVTASLDILFSNEDKIDIHFVKNKLLLEESRQRKQGHRDNVALSPSAFMGHTRGRGKLPSYRGIANNFQYRCHKCRSFGHKRTECPEENNEERAKFHQNGSQPQPNYRYPSKYGSSTPSIRRSGPSTSHVETEEREEEISFACDAQDSLDHPGESVEPPPSVEFLVDSGASDHLISDDTYLTEIEELRTPIVIRVAKQGQSLLATKKENRRLEEKEKESTPGKGTPSGTRQRKPPNWLKDFDISAHFAYSAADWISDVPKTRKEIHGREDEHLWEAAIQEELESMEKHKTWTRVEKPKNEEIIDSRWVFRIKKNEATGEERYKARLVAKGFQSSNYADTYSPVGKLSTFRTLISIVNEFNYEMEQMDVKTAFLHGDLKETIFMNLPEEMAEKNHVCKLNRSIYGLKQSPKNWYEKFDEFMLKENFKRSYHDSCLYSKITPKFKIYCFIYVDDLIIASDSLIQMKNFKSKLYQNFDMVNLGNVKSFLGLEVERDRDKGIIKLHQSAYINQLLRKFQMQDCKEISTPIEKNLRLNKAKSDEEKTEEPYRQLVGCLMYLMIGSRPDISFALNYFSRYQEYATNEHWTHLKRVLRYLKATNRLGLTFSRNNCENLIESYVDADWANDFEDRKSVTGFLVNVFGNIVSWGTRKQSTVSLSSTEAEYKALTTVICESLFINGILKDILCTEQPIVIFEDNVSCIHLAKNGENNKRTKHVEIKYHFIREKIKNNSVILKYIPTNDQRADSLTKALDVKKFNYFRNLMNIDVC
ncbi:unnamed protein product [Nesidiocoris tenuis]|uniref:CCHC-type domain-containing protein n=1 Tax=Nesidiocoris tenuis TaxID=355587 RepID=A0A6H5H298_9HEMI|nr:unnamed protein product [Nesidiocoris tenuis]